MTNEQLAFEIALDLKKRVEELERRVAELESITMTLKPLGPRYDSPEEQRRRSEELDRVVRQAASELGWYCDNCKNIHGPDVKTCPQPSRFDSLRDRIGGASNG